MRKLFILIFICSLSSCEKKIEGLKSGIFKYESNYYTPDYRVYDENSNKLISSLIFENTAKLKFEAPIEEHLSVVGLTDFYENNYSKYKDIISSLESLAKSNDLELDNGYVRDTATNDSWIYTSSLLIPYGYSIEFQYDYEILNNNQIKLIPIKNSPHNSLKSVDENIMKFLKKYRNIRLQAKNYEFYDGNMHSSKVFLFYDSIYKSFSKANYFLNKTSNNYMLENLDYVFSYEEVR